MKQKSYQAAVLDVKYLIIYERFSCTVRQFVVSQFSLKIMENATDGDR